MQVNSHYIYFGMIKRREFIKNCFVAFVPNVISKLISEYDYHINGECELTLKDENAYNYNMLSNNYMVCGTGRSTIKIWNAHSWDITKEISQTVTSSECSNSTGKCE